METTVQVIKQKRKSVYNDLNNEKLSEIFNHEDTLVSLNITNINLVKRMATLRLAVRFEHQGKKYFYTYEGIEAKITKNCNYWLTVSKPVKDENGQMTTENSTGFQRYLQSCNIPTGTKIFNLTFESLNGSNSYQENPFRLNIHKDYKKATLYNVQESRYVKGIYYNPENPSKPFVRYYKRKRKDNGKVLTLSKNAYKRLEVK